MKSFSFPRYTLVLWLLLVPIACDSEIAPTTTAGAGGSTASGGSGGQAGAGPTGSLEGYCGAVCDERYRCGTLDASDEPRAECVAACVAEWGPLDVYRGDVFGAIEACLETLECSRSIDECNIAGVNVVSTDGENDPLVVSCMAKTNSCSGSANAFNDDICLVGFFLLESVKPTFNACMAEPCAAVRACFDALRGK